MKQEVKISDYEEEQHLMMLALNLVGLSVNYTTVDLIHSTLAKLKEAKDSMDLHDAVYIKSQHERKWENYFKEQTKTE
jgi:predicted nucleotidyltransferase